MVNDMKKKVLTLIILSLLFIVGCGNKDSNEGNGKLLVVLAKYNFKYGATYDGVAIFDDGTVYTRYLSTTKSDYNNAMGSYSINTKSGIEKLYLEKGIKKEKKITKSDIASINNYINGINNKNIDTTCSGDGKIYTTLYIIKKDEMIKFNVSDCEQNSSNNNVKELLTMINNNKK